MVLQECTVAIGGNRDRWSKSKMHTQETKGTAQQEGKQLHHLV